MINHGASFIIPPVETLEERAVSDMAFLPVKLSCSNYEKIRHFKLGDIYEETGLGQKYKNINVMKSFKRKTWFLFSE